MIRLNKQEYIQIHILSTNSGNLSAWKSTDSPDDQWDDFLESSSFAHFYQSSKWAEVRKLDGWQPLLVMITRNDQIVGGFQILWRSKRFLGKIGLVLKGPVATTDDTVVLNFVLATLKKTAQMHDIRALIIQPADRDDTMLAALKQSEFSNNHIDFAVKTNTVIVNLKKDEHTLFKALKSDKRKNAKKALKNNIIIRDGDVDDLNVFFHFMTETCKRQNVKPSPSSLDFLNKIWSLFSSNGNIRMIIAEYEKKPVSANLLILFGNTCFLWKFGWSGELGHYHPNELLYWETLKFANNHALTYADVGAIDHDMATLLLEKTSLAQEMLKSYSYFKVGFGGDVLPLSKGFVYIPNQIIRLGYNILMPFINRHPYLRKNLF